jgi:hypothetical protein
MILWDIASGERLRTFEGHDRGLACIEFKVCLFPRCSEESITFSILCLERSHCIWFQRLQNQGLECSNGGMPSNIGGTRRPCSSIVV